jgi:hypothetical protein
MTLATVDGAFDLEIDSLSPDATRTDLVSIYAGSIIIDDKAFEMA